MVGTTREECESFHVCGLTIWVWSERVDCGRDSQTRDVNCEEAVCGMTDNSTRHDGRFKRDETRGSTTKQAPITQLLIYRVEQQQVVVTTIDEEESVNLKRQVI